MMIENSSIATETISVLLGSVGLLIVSIFSVILCACLRSSKDNSPNNKQTSAADKGVVFTKVDDVKINVNDGASPVSNNETTNGVLRNSGGSPTGGSSPNPPGANHRELPQPPGPSRSNTIGGNSHRLPLGADGGDRSSHRNTVTVIEYGEEPEDDYDHLTRPGIAKDGRRVSNYDHVTIGEDGVFKVKPRKPDNQLRQTSTENDYAEVDRENIYEGVKDNDSKGVDKDSKVKDEFSDGSFKDIDPYARVKDDPYAKVKGDEPPYSKVKDDPYSKVKDQGENNASGGMYKDIDPYSVVKDQESSGGMFKDIDPYSKVKEDPYSDLKDDDDPYNKVKDDKEDPYNRVKDDKEDPYNKVKDDKDDPYSRVKDDPYNKVKEEDPYNRVDDDGSTSSEQLKRISYQYSTVNKVGSTTQGATENGDGGGGAAFSIDNSGGQYAQVMKIRENGDSRPTQLQPPTGSVNRRSDTDPYTLPPEPPRRYNVPDDSVTMATDTVTSTQPADNPPVPASGMVMNGAEAVGAEAPPVSDGVKKKEPPYHKLTARESMASINARREMNTYEEVPENMYATVEGGSGDGVVTARAKKSSEEHRGVVRNDVYSEIEEAGTRVPAPPSLDSLHMVTKTDCKNRLSAELDSHGDRSSFADNQVSPGTTPINRLSGGSIGVVIAHPSNGVINHAFDESENAGVMLDPNYQTVRDCIPDGDGDMDPNYESVDEAKSKAGLEDKLVEERKMMMDRKKRLHVYEEVKPGECEEVRDRVLRSHMYEDLDGVKKEKENLEKNTEPKQKRNSEVWKRRSDIEEDEKL